MRKIAILCLAGAAAVSLAACGGRNASKDNVMTFEKQKDHVVTLFSPMEKNSYLGRRAARCDSGLYHVHGGGLPR